MKIYEIGTGYTPIPAAMGAATEIVVEELAKAFQEQGVPVEIIDIMAEGRETALPIQEVWVPKCLRGTDVQLGLMHKVKRVVYSVFLAGKLKELLKHSEEQVVLHFHNQYNLFFFLKLVPRRLRRKARLTYTVHSYVWCDPWERIADTVKKRYFQEIYCVKHADDVMVLNRKTAENFAEHLGMDERKLHTAINGVNTAVYRPLEASAAAGFKRTLGLENKRILLQVGSVCDRKNQLGALRQLCGSLQRNPNLVYAYAGGVIDGDYQEEIKAYAREKGVSAQVIYLGELCPGEELNRYYNVAEATIFPSKKEAFGLVILESLACGTPIILEEEPLFALENGYYTYHTAHELTEILSALSKERDNQEKMRQEVAARYSWSRAAREHLALWETT